MILTFFTKNEKWLHSIVFYGKTQVTIGCLREDELKRPTELLKGRFVSCEMEDDEELLGCELHYERRGTFGVTWIKWRPPQTSEKSSGLTDELPEHDGLPITVEILND